MSHIEIILEDLSNHPHCPHGPTVLFSRTSDGKRLNFFACAACRDRKDCSFYLCEDDKKVSDVKLKRWKEEKEKFIKGVNHSKLFVALNEVQQLTQNFRQYCHTCSELVPLKFQNKHEAHTIAKNISDHALAYPSELLEPLDNAKMEAQFLFSKIAVETIVDIIQNRNLKNVICMGAPRIHEYVSENCTNMSSILLDIDRRYHAFFGPLQFCWHNMFNNYFFLENSKQVFKDFLQTDKGKDMVLITDPPFGGRVELLAQTIKTVNQLYKSLNNTDQDLPVVFVFPYFMEPQILNSLPNFTMLDYKVDYDNHPLFKDGPKGRKLGSPVRIFTNIDPSTIELPADQGYKHCKLCNKWVSVENKHCKQCNACTSKDGRTYMHCNSCKRCVKPTWVHCAICKRCAQPDHVCQEIAFTQACFHCKKPGHKKRQCPQVNHEELQSKRKKGLKTKSKKCKKM